MATSNVVGINCPLVEIGLADLPKSGGVMATPTSLAPTALQVEMSHNVFSARRQTI
jgi:hypothetical protein